jgi:hypothetical protein
MVQCLTMTKEIFPPDRQPLDQQLSVLVTHEMKAFLLGTATDEKVSEADVARRGLAYAMRKARVRLGTEEYERIVGLGTELLASRARRSTDPAGPPSA